MQGGEEVAAGRRLSSARMACFRAAASCFKRVSIMVLPTRWMFSAGCPSRRRFSFASEEVVKSIRVSESVTRRFISSGIERSKERRPASTWESSLALAAFVSYKIWAFDQATRG
ncbi:MAG: hypothetical protein M3522_09600 [Actinomycetota bacterium]|nr:hypothetical protein [Actinomycetota bacterium]